MLHTPVLLQEVIKFLDPREGNFVIDGTIDGGGHSSEILKRILPTGKLLGIDWDKTMIAKVRERISEKLQIPHLRQGFGGQATPNFQKNLILECGNYANLPEILQEKNLPKADGLLLDLGFSSEQLESGKGFSFEKDEPLKMTYDDSRKPVAQILKEIKEKELADTIFKFGGERYSRRIAKAIKERVKKKSTLKARELREVILSAVPKNYERGRIDPATRTFQALRIYANDELWNLEQVLKNLPKVLKLGGKAVIVSFHSLEDRIVKNVFRDYAKAGLAEILTKKPVTPSEEEIKMNPRARSAKLRAARVIANNANNSK